MCLLLAIAILRRPVARAAASIVATMLIVAFLTSPANAAGLLIADGGFGGVLEIKEQVVKVTINNGIAVTEVEQTFVNKENRIVEALYTFPIPKRASVSNFSMWINGQEMIGEVVEKERARQIYESYKQTRRDPGLLEQVDYKRFEMRIFPIAAGAEQRVRVTYYQELDFDHDTAAYVYPLATVARRDADSRTTGRFALSLDVKSEVPITALVSPSHRDQFAIVKHADAHYWQAAMETKAGDLSQDVVINLSLARPRTGVDLVTSKTDGEDGYFQLTLTAGKDLEQQIGGADYVFLLDVSGSMMLDGKLATSRKSIEAFTDALGKEDRFEVITFNIAADALFDKLTDVNDETKKQATEHLRSQRASGGTVLRPALDAAYRYRASDRPLNVVLLSDGMTEQQEQRELLEAIKRRPSGVTVFCVGVGNEVNRPLLTQLSEQAGSLAAFLSAGDDFEQQAGAFRRKLTRPAATDVKVAFQGGDVYDLEPATLPNLYHGQPVRMYGRYRKTGATSMKLSATVLGKEIEQQIELNLPERNDANPEIERMWAFRRVDRLLGEERETGSQQHQTEIIRLSEGYSIVSPYASFIVLENDGEYRRWQIERRNALRVVRDRAAQDAVRERLAQLREATANKVGPQGEETAQREEAAKPAESPLVRPGTDISFDAPRGADRSDDRGGGGGGGAIDPITALVAAGLAALGLASRRQRRSPANAT
jgi:Ca-activated chloride channel homolog